LAAEPPFNPASKPASANRAFIEWVVLVSVFTLALFSLLPGSYRAPTNEAVQGQGQGRDYNPISYFNNAIFDGANRLLAAPLNDKIVLIDIDEASLGQIGRWPWKRAVHARLIEFLSEPSSQPNRVLLDILFPEDAADDLVFGQGLTKHANTFLPIAPQVDSAGIAAPIYPVAKIGKAAAGLGHAQFSLDHDGVVRGLYLNEGGFNAISTLLTEGVQNDLQARDQAIASGRWSQKNYVHLPAIAGVIPRVSYGQVLRGEIAGQYFKNKLVLVGATARGLGDSYANALVNQGALSPGIELHAVAVSALLDKKTIRPIDPMLHQTLSFAIFGAVMVMLYRLRPRPAIVMTALVLVLVGLSTLAALKAGLWVAPGALMLLVFLAYPLWSWRRLEASFARLAQRAAQLASNPLKLPSFQQNQVTVEPIARSLQALDDAAEYALALRDFLRQIIDEIPYPVWVGDPNDKPLLSNSAAERFFPASKTMEIPVAKWLMTLFGEITLEDGKEFLLNDHSWLLRLQSFQPTKDQSYNVTLWLYQLIDVTTLRQTQRERDQMMRFLSHDMRSPQVSILSILQQQSADDQNLSWIKSIKSQTERTLELADGVVQLARAESTALRSEPIGLDDLLAECSDSCWALAHAKAIKLNQTAYADDLEIYGDPTLLRRAFINLIDNAIKFSPRDSRISLDAKLEGDWVSIAISDEGVGIKEDQLELVFKPYWRADERVSGVGLGLSFVNLVATRHGGSMKVERNQPQGCRFIMRLPKSLS
jgi:signal transduction histidine kinase/CHASE2 domain-containing sensor protein